MRILYKKLFLYALELSIIKLNFFINFSSGFK